MKSLKAVGVVVVLVLSSIIVFSASNHKTTSKSIEPTVITLSVEILIEPYTTVYEGDLIKCSITGDPEIMYWMINNQSKHTTFFNNYPLIFNPEPTPLEDNYVDLTVYVENSQGNSSHTIPIILKKIFYGDIHCHSTLAEGDFTLEEIYEGTISDNYLDFTAFSDHANMEYPSNTRLFPIIRGIFNKLTKRDPWELSKEYVNKYYNPGNFTTLLGYEWSASNMFPGGKKWSSNGHEDVSHICFYYREVYPDAKKFTMRDKKTYDDIFEVMAKEYDKGNLNICYPHHTQGKIYLFSSTLVKNHELLKNIKFLEKFVYDFTANFTFMANNMKNSDARDKILRGTEVYSRWGLSMGPYSNLSQTWPYYPDDPLLGVVGANMTEAWTENAMWEWSQDKFIGKKFVMQMGSDTHHVDRTGSAFLWRDKPAGLISVYAVHNTREEIWDAMDICDTYGSQLLKIRANVRFDDKIALGRWINCNSPLKINITAMSTFNGFDNSGKTICPHLYDANELDYPISDIWIVKKDTDRGQPWCKIIGHFQPNENHTFVSFEDPDVQPNDFYYVAIRQKGAELFEGNDYYPKQDQYTAILGPVFIENVNDV